MVRSNTSVSAAPTVHYTQYTEVIKQRNLMASRREQYRRQGFYTVEGEFFKNIQRFIEWLFGLEDRRLADITDLYTNYMDKLEKVRIRFTQDGVQPLLSQRDFRMHLAGAMEVLKCSDQNKSGIVKKARNELRRRIIALQYRVEGEKGGLDKHKGDLTQEQCERLEKLHTIAEARKAKFPLFKEHEQALTADDLKRLESAIRYTEFGKLLLEDKALQEKFMKWVLRDRLPVNVIVQFPRVHSQISGCPLAPRIHRVAKKSLRLEKINGKKDVTLPFQVHEKGELTTKRISVLDEETAVNFAPKFRPKLKEIYHIFSEKTKDIPGNVEYMDGVVTSWNNEKMARWDGEKYHGIDFNQKQWWKQLTPFETITIEEANKRYGDHMDGQNGTVLASASIESVKMEFEGVHGYLVAVLPTDDGRYAVYPFGKFPKMLPGQVGQAVARVPFLGAVGRAFELIAYVFFIANTVKASIHYTDYNVYHARRQQWGCPFKLEPEQIQKLMDCIKRDLHLGWQTDGNLVFQFEDKNCMEWAESTIREVLGDENLPEVISRVPIVETESSNPILGPRLRSFRGLKQKDQIQAIKDFNSWFFPGRSLTLKNAHGQTVVESASKSRLYKDGKIFHPVYMVKQLQEGKLPMRVVEKITQEATSA